ncbi:hypothetical protein PYCC9005_000602 [Savitreella phatthalungensis]
MQSFLARRSFQTKAKEQLKRHGLLRTESSEPSPPSDSRHTGETIEGDGALLPSTNDPQDHQSGDSEGTLTPTVTGTHAEKNVLQVEFSGPDDDMNPHNWSLKKRWGVTLCTVLVCFIVGFASSVDSVAIKAAAQEFGVSEIAQTLEVSLYLVGFAFGALVSGPFSETFGRNPVYLGTLFLFMIWIMASALAPNFAALIIFRLIAGFFGATPLVVTGGSLSDVWTPIERSLTFPIFANSAFLGPVSGPVVGGYVAQQLGPRFDEWVTMWWAAATLIILFFLMPETHAPTLLKWKAQEMRKLSGDNRFRAEIEMRQETFIQRCEHSLIRPFQMICQEPIIMLIALYMSVVYIILFGFFSAFEFLFTQTYGLNTGLTGISFVGIDVGICLGTLFTPFMYKRYKHKAEAAHQAALPPEERLLLAMLTGWCIPAGLFWLAWTNYPSIPIWSSLGATALVGIGILGIFIPCYQYIIDAYTQYAASGLAAITFLRYLVSGGAVIFTIPMYKNLGVHWATSLLAFLSAACVPIPFAFYFYGERIRSRSRYAQT